MKCVYHNSKDAEFICSSCGQPICRDCAAVMDGKTICKACEYRNAQYNMEPYNVPQFKKHDGVNGFLFFIFLAVPGLRHMYLGLMKRGMQFLTLFFGFAAIFMFLQPIEVLAGPIMAIVWFYSAFDSYNLRKLMQRGENVEDSPILEDIDFGGITDFVQKRRYLVGIVIIVIGVYMFLKQLQRYMMRYRVPRIVFEIIDFGFDAIIPLLFIAGGVYLLLKVRNIKDVKGNEE